jgi:hypothetical protein
VTVTLPTGGRGEVAARIATAPGGWSLVVSPLGKETQEASAFLAQLGIHLDGPMKQMSIRTPNDVISASQAATDSVLVLDGFAAFQEADWRKLDAFRSRLHRAAPAVMVMSAPQLQLLVANAPNFWSWIGASFWSLTDDSVLTPEQREARLTTLRQRHELSDEEILIRVQQGTLPPDPDFAEWVVLLGKGDLLSPPEAK